ncbi:hypothetical protein D7V94_22515 [Parablautia intestinalis]|jgi:hypothetical protein|uniref:Uncharacterized protein n=1 Tax=Parablautia intestinalis TaxID=2320100 RepID=A0A3A9A5U2_9FIRM|nr:hypothetical protein [Parablautia intestinalis]RKI86859.1 hypothetical protein D7V94_22515 [Parablautia intestinalis]
MKITNIQTCYRITLENGSYGMETYIDVGSKLKITFDNGAILIGYMVRVEYGDYPKENDFFIINAGNGEFYGAMVDRITDIEELSE